MNLQNRIFKIQIFVRTLFLTSSTNFSAPSSNPVWKSLCLRSLYCKKMARNFLYKMFLILISPKFSIIMNGKCNNIMSRTMCYNWKTNEVGQASWVMGINNGINHLTWFTNIVHYSKMTPSVGILYPACWAGRFCISCWVVNSDFISRCKSVIFCFNF